jgi:hypothetical protein
MLLFLGMCVLPLWGQSLSIDDVSVAEGDTATFTVTLSNPDGTTVTVDYVTTAGTATAGSDYTAVSGWLTFPSGVTIQSIAVTTLQDTSSESDETFTVDLSHPTNATISDSQGLGTILDDDECTSCDCLDCGWHCSAQDLEITGARLEIPGVGCSCEPGDDVSVDLVIDVYSKNVRYDLCVNGDFYTDSDPGGIELSATCTSSILAKATTSIRFPAIATIECGDAAWLEDVVVSWVPSGQATGCATLGCISRAAKCFGPVDIVVDPPLTADISPDPPNPCVGTALQLDGNPFGGTLPYITHSWTGDGAAYLTDTAIQAPVFLGTAPVGTYVLIYTVTDSSLPLSHCTATDSVTVTVKPLPNCTIFADSEVCSGGQYTASGPSGLSSYLWSIANGTIDGGQGTSTLTYTAGTAGSNVVFTLIVEDEYGCSNTCVLEVPVIDCCVPPVVTLHPTSQSCVCPGSPVSFTVNASGSSPLSYQWRKDGGVITGATSATYTIASVTGSDSGSYDCVVTNACGSVISNPATLDVDTTTPVITCPAAVTVECSADVPAVDTASVTVSDNCTPTAQIIVRHISDVSDNNTCPETITRTYEAEDLCGNTARCTQTITVDDTTDPTATNPAPVTVQCMGDVPAADISVVTDERIRWLPLLVTYRMATVVRQSSPAPTLLPMTVRTRYW